MHLRVFFVCKQSATQGMSSSDSSLSSYGASGGGQNLRLSAVDLGEDPIKRRHGVGVCVCSCFNLVKNK